MGTGLAVVLVLCLYSHLRVPLVLLEFWDEREFTEGQGMLEDRSIDVVVGRYRIRQYSLGI